MEQKSSKVVRIKCHQRINGEGVASFIFAILLVDGKSFTFSVRFVDDKKFYKDLFLVEVGDTIVYDGDEIVDIKFAI